MSDYDILVVGGGPGGYVAAIRAAQLGFKVAVIERKHLGGICLNWGCIPTKALLRSAEIYHYINHASEYGIKLSGTASIDIGAVVKRSREVAAQLNGGIGFLLKKNKVDVIWGEAEIIKPGEIKVSAPKTDERAPYHLEPKGALHGGIYQAKHIIVATGARPRLLPGAEPDGRLIWTYFDAMIPKEVPKSLMIVGSGAIGIEFASFYRTLGSDVTIVEVLPQILPLEDSEIAAMARRRFEAQGIRIMTGTKVTKVEKAGNSITAFVEDDKGRKSTLNAERMISAVGVVGNIENLGLDKIGVKTDRGCIVIDDFCRTNVPGIYAIGDVAGPPMLAHKAEHEGVACVEAIKGLKVSPVDKKRIPGCVYCYPQIASVGLTEAKAREGGAELKVGRFPFAGNGKAIALGEPDGMIKTIFDARTGELLGAHMIGAEVTELIHGYVTAMTLETTEHELAHTIYPHPTLSEMLHESALDAYGNAIHR